MSQLLSSSPEFGFHSWSCAFLRFFLSDSCHERDGGVQITFHRTHTHARISTLFSVRALHVITRVPQDILRASTVILSSVMSLLNILSISFPPIFSSPTTSLTPPTTSPTPLSGIRLNSCAALLGDGPVRSQTHVGSRTSIKFGALSPRHPKVTKSAIITAAFMSRNRA